MYFPLYTTLTCVTQSINAVLNLAFNTFCGWAPQIITYNCHFNSVILPRDWLIFVHSSEVDQHDAHEPVLLLVVAGAHGQFTINVDLTRSKGHIGDGFTASCRVINEQKIPYFIVWERKAAGHTVEIASNENINYEFHKTGRYSANLTMDRDNDIGEVTFYLRISGELRTLPHRVTEISQVRTILRPVISVATILFYNFNTFFNVNNIQYNYYFIVMCVNKYTVFQFVLNNNNDNSTCVLERPQIKARFGGWRTYIYIYMD